MSLPPAALTVPEQQPRPARVTFEEFLTWSNGEGRAEWVDGEIVLMSPCSLDHQDLVGFLYRLLVVFLERHDLGRVWVAPIAMRLVTRPSGREPDVLFVAHEHADRLRSTYVDGPADLAVEVVSPDSDARDRGEKFVEYEGGGVPEYWLLDPLRREAFFYQIGADGRYRAGPIDKDDYYSSVVLPGFRLKVEWLWQRPLPPVSEIASLIEA